MRAFLAIELPEELKEKIFAVSQRTVRRANIKLVEKENLHLTLLFLGKIDEDEKGKIKEGLGGLEGPGKIRLKLGKVEVFPNKKRPHGVWINVEGEKEKLFSLYKKIVDGLLKAGIRLEEKTLRFSPHITVGRMRKSTRWEGIEGTRGLEGQEFTVEKVAFFQSKLSSKGPKYTHLT